PLTVSLIRSLLSMPRALAVAGETIAALSQTSLVTGSGISCSQVLFACAPSTIFGQGANVTLSDCGPPLAATTRLSIAAATSPPRRTGGGGGCCGRDETPRANARFHSRSRSVAWTGTALPAASWHSTLPSVRGPQPLRPWAPR